MSDSIEMEFKVEHIDSAALANKMLWNKGGVIVENGIVTNVSGVKDYAYGLSKAKNVVTPVLNKQSTNPFKPTAYKLSLNGPASLIGNNALVQNMVYDNARLGKLVLQKYLLTKGVPADAVDQISLKHGKLTSVTLTYLFRFDSHDKAVKALQEFRDHARTVLDNHAGYSRKGKSKGNRQIVTPVGTAPSLTVYINRNGTDLPFGVAAYVKASKTTKAHAQFQSPQIEDAVYAESDKHVRLEIILPKTWLTKEGLRNPFAWKASKGAEKIHQNLDGPEKVHQKALQQLRGLLRLKAKGMLRTNKPQERHMTGLATDARAVLDDHLNGRNPWRHPNMRPEKRRATGIHQEILKTVHIDLTIPWKQQSQHVSADLAKWLQYPGEYQAPPHLANACYVRSTARKKRGELQAQIDQLKRDAAGRPSDPHADANQARVQELWKEICTLSNVERGGGSDSTADISDLLG